MRVRAGGRGAATTLWVAFVWALATGGVGAQEATVQGTVEVGSADNEVTLVVRNLNAALTVEGVRLTPVGTPRLVSNVRISPARVARLTPKASQDFTVLFDVRPDAPEGRSETLVFAISADRGTRLDNTRLTVTVTVVKPEPATPGPAVAGPAGSGPPGGAGGPGPAVAPALKLVRITGPRAGESGPHRTEYREGGSGYSLRAVWPRPAGAGRAAPSAGGVATDCGNPCPTARAMPENQWLMSVRVLRAPVEIVPGRPIAVEAEARYRRYYEDGHSCGTTPRVGVPSVRITGTPFWAEAGSKDDVSSPCPSGTGAGTRGAVTAARERDASLRITLRLNPVSQSYDAASKRWRFVYAYDAVSDGRDVRGGNGMNDGQRSRELGMDRIDVELRTRVLDAGSDTLSVLTLEYRVPKPGEPALASLPPYDHPAELRRPPRDGTGVAGGGPGPAGATPGGASGDGAAGGPRPVPIDPSRLDPASSQVAALIREWLGVAEPPDNARGARLRYDEWGRAVGTGVNGEAISAGARPDGGAGQTPAEFAWQLRDRLDSVNHCTLGEYVVARLGNASIGRCQGRHRPMPPVTVASVVGLTWAEAEQRLAAAGLTAEAGPGDAPRSRAEEFTVQRQDPAPGARLAPGSKVKVAIRPAYVEPARPVPDVTGRPAAEATAALKHAGFEAALQGGAAPASRREEYTVERTDPGPGVALAAGRTVTVYVRPGYVEARRAVPDVSGRRYAEAEAALRQAGFAVTVEGGSVPATKVQEHTVEAQRPRAGDAGAPGSTVTLRIYASYVEPPPPVGRGPGTGSGVPTGPGGGGPPAGPAIAAPLGCPPIPGMTQFIPHPPQSDHMICEYNGRMGPVNVTFSWAPPESPTRLACGRARSSRDVMTSGPVQLWHTLLTVPSRERSAEVRLRVLQGRPPTDAMMAAWERVLVEQVEPRAAPCGGGPAPPQARPAVPPRPPAPGRGGTTVPPSGAPPGDPCPGGSISLLGQSCQ